MLTIQKPFEALAHLCASLEIMQSQDYTLRSQVTRIKELCITLLRTPPDLAEKVLQRLPFLLKPLSNKMAHTSADQDLLENLTEMKNDAPTRKEFHTRLVAMEDYGLASDEDEDTKAQMRIDAFNEAINDAKANMNAPPERQVTFRMHTSRSLFASDTTKSPQLTEEPLSLDDMAYKIKEGESAPVISDEEKAAFLEKEEKALRNEQNYRDAFNNLRPGNLTIPELFLIIIHKYKTNHILNDPDDQSSKALERIYFKKLIIDLLEKKIISYQESIQLFALFNEHNDNIYLREPKYAPQHDQLNDAIYELTAKKIITFKEAKNLIDFSANVVSEIKNEPPAATKRSP